MCLHACCVFRLCPDAVPDLLTADSADSLAIAASALAALQSSVSCNIESITRLEANVVAAASHVSADASTVIDSLHRCVPSFVSRARRRSQAVAKLLTMKGEELDAGVKTLLSFLRHIEAGGDTLQCHDIVSEGSIVVRGLVEDVIVLTDVSVALSPASWEPLQQVSTSCRVVTGVDCSRSNVSLIVPWFARDSINTVIITVLDCANQPVYGVTQSDVVTVFDKEASGWTVSSVTVAGNVVTLLIVPAVECTHTALLQTDIGGATFRIPLQVSEACICRLILALSFHSFSLIRSRLSSFFVWYR